MSRKKIRACLARLDGAIAKAQAAVCPPVVLLHFRNSPERCFYCGVILCDETATVDHIKPLMHGGDNSPANLVPACSRCNNLKGCSRIGKFRRHFPGRMFWAEIQYRAMLDCPNMPQTCPKDETQETEKR